MLSERLPKLFLPRPRGPLVWPTIYGFSLCINPLQDAGVEHSLYYRGAYERGTLDVLGKLLRPGDHFADVGANIGLMSVFAARIIGSEGRVSAFEPHPETAEILRKNIALNALSTVEVYQTASGSAAGLSALAEGPEGNRGAAYTLPSLTEYGAHEVRVARMDEVLKSVRPPDVVKIDAEGDEPEVLRGMEGIFEHSCPAIIAESSRNVGAGNFDGTALIFDMLNSRGYQIFKALKGKGIPSDLIKIRTAADMPAHDNIYGFAKKHLSRLPPKLLQRSS